MRPTRNRPLTEFLGLFLIGITHLTGITTNAGIHTVDGTRPGEFYLLILSFFCGSLIGGLILGKTRKKFRGRQAAVFLVEAAVLFIAYGWTREGGGFRGAYLVALAAGLQNTVTSNMSAVVLRTTHVTGAIVDIGMTIGQMISMGSLQYAWKLKLLVPAYVSFWLGTISGGQAFARIGVDGLLVAACAIGAIGVACCLWALAVERNMPPDEELESLEVVEVQSVGE